MKIRAFSVTTAPSYISTNDNGGVGADTLTGGTGADRFVFDALDGAVDTVTDFSAAEGDTLDIRAILSEEFDPVTDLISHFVEATTQGNDTVISVDRDGSGNSFAAIAILQGVTGVSVHTLLADGNLAAS